MNDQTTRIVMGLLQNTEPGVSLIIVPGVWMPIKPLKAYSSSHSERRNSWLSSDALCNLVI